jgi:nucleoside-diphosphate-sugar epimerase
MRFTVLGANGFIGSHLADHLRRRGDECLTPARDEPLDPRADMGHTIFSIGLTADFRQRPMDTVRAHVCRLLEVLDGGRFQSLLYLSSTRVYGGGERGDEDAPLRVSPQDPSDLYNLSKLTGESLCFGASRPEVRVVRLSNVYGGEQQSPDFLGLLVRAAVDEGEIVLASAPESVKDYVAIGDVVALAVRIAEGGRRRLYNVASGVNVTHRAIIERLRQITGCRVRFTPGAPRQAFPPIGIDRIREEFGFEPAGVLGALEGLVGAYRKKEGHP